MYVKTRMTANPHTIDVDAPITDVIALMREKELKRVPVVKGDQVVGMVTEGDIQKVSPNKATSLSIFEINYLLAKTTVKSAMSKEVHTISPDQFLEEAAVVMRSNRVSALPVVEDGRLVGIITESDIFDAFVELLGFKDVGSRISIESYDKPGVLAKVAAIIASFNVNISHIAAYSQPGGLCDVVVRVDAADVKDIVKEIENNGFKILNVMKNN